MGVDYLFLDCVRGVSFAEVSGAVTRVLAREGWRPLRGPAVRTKRGDEVRAVAVIEEAGWWIVEERDASRFPIEWADKLARELGTVAICVRSSSDDGTFSIDRYNGDVEAGSVRLGDPGRRRRPVQVRAPFLSDLACSPKRRAALIEGVSCGPLESDKTAIELARLAGLPRLLDRYHDSKPTHRYHRAVRVVPSIGPARVREMAARPSRPAKLQLRDSFHIRGITRARLMRGVASILNEAGLVERTTPLQKKERELFLAASGAWQSLGEVTYGADLLWGGLPLDWAIHLSKRLAVPVLMVRAHETWIELAVFEDGRRGPIVTVPPPSGAANLGPLVSAGLAVADIDSTRTRRRPRTRAAAARQIGALLDLTHPVLEGKLEGVVVSLCTTGEALRHPALLI